MCSAPCSGATWRARRPTITATSPSNASSSVPRGPSFVRRAGGGGTRRVAVIWGGGSGHEPLHTGFVGVGMLDAAVPGGIFASPTAAQIHAATTAVDRGQGVVHVVKNYTGDVIN